ncbi:hypothetical protein [Hippea alviniae]|uniref:hypothetical protein n=1 Tax=Hippea alviniae TaxID=1279027 RepID=UPI0012DE00A6|nr:hypothetical protein [Hippea alviniae]
MKRKVFLSVMLFAFIGSFSFAGSVCDRVSLSKIMPYMPADYRVIHKKPLKNTNLCDMLIEVNGKLFTVYANEKIAIVGTLFKNGSNISSQEINRYLQSQFSKNFKLYGNKLKELAISTYKPSKKTRRFVYLVCDPNNRACEFLKRDLIDFAKKSGFGIKLILVGISQDAQNKIERFICNNKSFKDYTESNYGKDISCKRAKRYISESNRLIFEELKINSLPTFITQNGRYQAGSNLNTLKNILK